MNRPIDCGFNLTGWKMRGPSLRDALKSWCDRVAATRGRHALMPMPENCGSLLLGLGEDSRDVRYLAISDDVRAGGFDVVGLELNDIDTPCADLVCAAINDVMKRGTPAYVWSDFQGFLGSRQRWELLILPIGDLRIPRTVMMVDNMEDFKDRDIPDFLQAKVLKSPTPDFTAPGLRL